MGYSRHNGVYTLVGCKPSGQINNRLMRLLTTFILLTICLTTKGQTILTQKKDGIRIDTLIQPELGRMQKTPPDGLNGYIDTKIKYTNSTGNSIIIQNSLPLGGIGFTDNTGISFRHRLFWTHVINEADTPLELTITFPADSIALPEKNSYVKVFLHPDGVTQESKTLFDDGKAKDFAGKLFGDTTKLKSLCHIPTKIQKIIKPKEAILFCTVVLRHNPKGVNSPRAGFVLKQQGLFYKIPDLGSTLIPCGNIVFKNRGYSKKNKASTQHW